MKKPKFGTYVTGDAIPVYPPQKDEKVKKPDASKRRGNVPVKKK